MRRLALIMASVVIILSAALFFLTPREPWCRGRPLSAWLTTYRKIYAGNLTNPGVQETRDALLEIGTNSLPWLLRWLGSEQPTWKQNALILHDQLPKGLRSKFIRGQIDGQKEANRVTEASLAFGFLGTNAGPAAHELEALAVQRARPVVADRAMDVLRRLGKDALPSLMIIAANTNSLQRTAAIFAFGALRADAAPAMP